MCSKYLVYKDHYFRTHDRAEGLREFHEFGLPVVHAQWCVMRLWIHFLDKREDDDVLFYATNPNLVSCKIFGFVTST